VHTIATGLAPLVAAHMPNATKAALRSSTTTIFLIVEVRVKAITSGAFLDPGEITTSFTPCFCNNATIILHASLSVVIITSTKLQNSPKYPITLLKNQPLYPQYLHSKFWENAPQDQNYDKNHIHCVDKFKLKLKTYQTAHYNIVQHKLDFLAILIQNKSVSLGKITLSQYLLLKIYATFYTFTRSHPILGA
jgi:hypothetical protein